MSLLNSTTFNFKLSSVSGKFLYSNSLQKVLDPCQKVLDSYLKVLDPCQKVLDSYIRLNVIRTTQFRTIQKSILGEEKNNQPRDDLEKQVGKIEDSSTYCFSELFLNEQNGKSEFKRKLRKSGKKHILKTLEFIGWEEIECDLRKGREDSAIVTLESIHVKIKGLSQDHKQLLKKIAELPDNNNELKRWNSKDLFYTNSNTLKKPSSSLLSQQVKLLESRSLVECLRGTKGGKKTYIEFVRLTQLGSKVVKWAWQKKVNIDYGLSKKAKH